MCFIDFVDKTNIKQWSKEIEEKQSMNYCKTCAEQHAEQFKPATTEQQQQQQQQQPHQQVGPPSQPKSMPWACKTQSSKAYLASHMQGESSSNTSQPQTEADKKIGTDEPKATKIAEEYARMDKLCRLKNISMDWFNYIHLPGKKKDDGGEGFCNNQLIVWTSQTLTNKYTPKPTHMTVHVFCAVEVRREADGWVNRWADGCWCGGSEWQGG